MSLFYTCPQCRTPNCDKEECAPFTPSATPMLDTAKDALIAELVEALNDAIFLLETSLKGQHGAFVNTVHEEDLPALKHKLSTAAKMGYK